MAPEERPLFDEVLDLALYAPVGLAVRAFEQLPGLAAAGKARIGNQVDQARVIGRFAVGVARSKAARSFERARPAPTSPAPPAADRPTAEEPAPTSSTAPAPGPEEVSTTDGPPVPPQAIPDYDALSASQVVPRLSGLTAEELAAVGRYEAATRHRRTILGRVAQLERELDGGRR